MNFLELTTLIGVEGFMHCSELEKLAGLAAGKRVLEIGSFKGLTAYCMAFVAKSVFCVDTFKANTAGQFQLAEFTTINEFCRNLARFNNVTWYAGTSAQAAENKGPFTPQGQFDLIFLDAMHTCEDVKADIARWWPRIVPGGTMAFHDYGHGDFPGVKQAVDEILMPPPPERQVITLAWFSKPQ